MEMILCVLNDPEQLDDVLTAWEECGVTGATVLPSTGLGRLRMAALQDDIPLIPSLEDLLQREEKYSRTLFTVVQDEAVTKRVVDTTLNILDQINEPNTGIIVVLPVLRAYGVVPKRRG